ncbi:hypothetical protein BDR05DRAFT_966301 [Suillus weaverae]|nr:hypothetical protein BDR05DRAFT_966301 [Suillus weaverae]
MACGSGLWVFLVILVSSTIWTIPVDKSTKQAFTSSHHRSTVIAGWGIWCVP